MKKLNPLNYQALRKTLKPTQLGFKTTAELASLTEFVGQERALEAVRFGIGIKSHGYNLYAMGPSGIGKRSLIRSVLQTAASKQKTPSDWCYIHNFDAPEKPIALKLPPGVGSLLQQDMKLFIEELSTTILAMFESDEYRLGMEEISNNFNLKREEILKNITETKSDKIPYLYKDRHEKEKQLQLKFTTGIVEPLIKRLKSKYEEFPEVLHFLTAVQVDIISYVNDFVKTDETTNLLMFVMDNPHLIKYQVNLLVDNSKTKGAPLVIEENPSYSNLISRVEHTLQLGVLTTNFTLIKAGALHRANGGYLIIEARKIKKDKVSWESLKRALYSKKIIIEPVENTTDSTRPVSIDPIPIPLDVKIILLGDRHTFYSLSNHDPDFNELFKVAVDFDEQIERNNKNIKLYARLISTIAKREGLKPFHVSAVSTIIDYSSQIAEDVEKLSTHIRNIDDLILESDYWSGLANKQLVDSGDVRKAMEKQIHRLDRTRELYYEDIKRDFVIIKTAGKVVGQVNCLSVVKVGKFSYGHPTRVTAKVRAGKGEVIDIQRKIKLAGPIHSKAGIIIANYLADHYSQDFLFSLTASISFEQIYGSVDGDSASVAELCALLSALSNVPLKQSLAITGSIDQNGEVQAIGGVNQKIEGFFDVCKAQGFTGNQGVIIPAVNVKNLMLREDVVAAAKAKKFFIYPIETVDEALHLITGLTALNVNEKVVKKLREFSKIRRKK